jgi:hypothetical protein
MRISRKVAVIAVAVLAFGAVGIAFAAWTASGTGSGAAQATSAQAVTYSDGTTTAQLYPTGSGDLVISVNNPNGYKIQITDVVGNGTITADAAHATAGCNASSVTFADQHSLTKVVNAATTADVTLTAAVSMSNAANDFCQGATFTVPVSVTAASTT